MRFKSFTRAVGVWVWNTPLEWYPQKSGVPRYKTYPTCWTHGPCALSPWNARTAGACRRDRASRCRICTTARTSPTWFHPTPGPSRRMRSRSLDHLSSSLIRQYSSLEEPWRNVTIITWCIRVHVLGGEVISAGRAVAGDHREAAPDDAWAGWGEGRRRWRRGGGVIEQGTASEPRGEAAASTGSRRVTGDGGGDLGCHSDCGFCHWFDFDCGLCTLPGPCGSDFTSRAIPFYFQHYYSFLCSLFCTINYSL